MLCHLSDLLTVCYLQKVYCTDQDCDHVLKYVTVYNIHIIHVNIDLHMPNKAIIISPEFESNGLFKCLKLWQYPCYTD